MNALSQAQLMAHALLVGGPIIMALCWIAHEAIGIRSEWERR
jgi:hypothetical protein